MSLMYFLFQGKVQVLIMQYMGGYRAGGILPYVNAKDDVDILYGYQDEAEIFRLLLLCRYQAT